MITMDKFTVGIVDDEYLVRHHIHKTIDWDSLNLEIVFEEESGIKVLKRIHEDIPDIVIADINMPGLNGIELSEAIHSIEPDCAIILLSGYNNTEYLHGAIRAGVIEFLEKPMDKVTLENTLKKITINLSEKRKQKNYIELLENKIDMARNMEREEIARKLIFSSVKKHFSPHVISEKLKLDRGDSILLAIAAVKSKDGFIPMQKYLSAGNAIYRIIKQQQENTESVLSLIPSNGQPVIIGNPDILHPFIKQVRKISEEILNLSFSIGFSSIVNSPELLKDAYKEANQALNEQFFITGEQENFTYSNMKRNFINIEGDFAHLYYFFQTADINQFNTELIRLFRKLTDERADRSSIYFLAVRIIAKISYHLKEYDLVLHTLVNRLEKDWETHIHCFETAEKLIHWLMYIARVSIEALSRDSRYKNHRSAKKAKEFINLHFADKNLTLRKLADEVGVSPGYLSRIFKREFNKNVVAYLSEKRLLEAKAILDGPDDVTVAEVAERVGYSDPLYFSRVFKQTFGIPPKKYIRKKPFQVRIAERIDPEA